MTRMKIKRADKVSLLSQQAKRDMFFLGLVLAFAATGTLAMSL